MNKIALVNLCSYEDISKWSTYDQDIAYLNDNNIPFVDYASGFDKKEDLLKKFYEALMDKNVSVIWFVNGGTRLIEYTNVLDWETIKNSNKVFIGLSDFTHFAILAANLNIPCYYGIALKKITKYFSIEKRNQIASFLISIANNNDTKLENVFSLEKEKIIGGHLGITLFMLNNFSINLQNKTLFLEHHYLLGETLTDLEYYLHQLSLYIILN